MYPGDKRSRSNRKNVEVSRMLKVIKRIGGKKRKISRLKREIAHLKKVRQEKIEDASYWYVQGNYEEYLRSVSQAIDINSKIKHRRMRQYAA